LTNPQVAKAETFHVSSYRKLMNHVARLSYLNKDYLLFYRGQGTDFTNKAGVTTLYPSIYRGDRLSREGLDTRFELLARCSHRICEALQKEKPELPGRIPGRHG
jgi:hypothetical protein